MEVYKNKASGRYFIHIDHVNTHTALLLNPLGDIKPLELRLFEKPAHSGKVSVALGIFTRQQIQNYKAYMNLRKREKALESVRNSVKEEFARLLSEPSHINPETDRLLKLINKFQKLNN